MHKADMNAEMLRHLYGFVPAKMDDLGDTVSEPTTVFRVEMPNGKGPYNSGLDNGTHEIYDFLDANGAVEPARRNNESMSMTGRAFHRAFGKAHYGLDSTAAVQHWFNWKVRHYLRDYGAELVEYEVQPGQNILPVGEGEVIFNKHLAKRVSSYDLVGMGAERAMQIA